MQATDGGAVGIDGLASWKSRTAKADRERHCQGWWRNLAMEGKARFRLRNSGTPDL